MRGGKRPVCLLLAVLLLMSAALTPAAAAPGSVVFTAVNDTLLTLADDTMPFYSGGMLYVASMAFDGTDLGIFYSRSRDRTTAALYKQRSVIIFDLAAGTIKTNGDQTYTGSAITRGDTVFLPVDIMCDYFELDYSYTRVSLGYLLRIKSDTVVLSDARFIDAASSAMSSRYNRYERTQTEQTTPIQTPVEQTPPQETTQRTVYPVIECTAPEASEPLLARLGGGRATYLFTPEGIGGADGLLRCLASGGGATALRIDARDGAENALTRIEAGNRALWAAANLKTRLVWLDGATEDTARRVREAGYCPISAALNLSGAGASASRLSARILAAADARGGSCCVFLGTDEEVSGVLGALLAALRTGNCTPARLNEVIASQR